MYGYAFSYWFKSGKINYSPFMVILDKYNRSCSAIDDWSMKICVPSETKDVNVKVRNMMRRIYKAETLVKHISWDCKWKSNSTHVIQIKNRIIKNVTVNVDVLYVQKRIIGRILAHVFVRLEDIWKALLKFQ